MRHAEAAPAGKDGDRERPLTQTGKRQARQSGADLAAGALGPAHVLCSPALRTRQTWEEMAALFPQASADYDPRAYNADSQTLFECLGEIKNEGPVLLIAHNPGVQMLTLFLTRQLVNFTPATRVTISCPCEGWDGLAPGANTLEGSLPPKSP